MKSIKSLRNENKCHTLGQDSVPPPLPEGSEAYTPFMNDLEITALTMAFQLFRAPVQALEWGSGTSTIYFPARLSAGSKWLSVEHNADWAEKVKGFIAAAGAQCSEIVHVPCSDSWHEGDGDGSYAEFYNYINFPTTLGKKFQLILVDGRARVDCLLTGWSLLDEAGLMILHDAQRREYLQGTPRDCNFLRMSNPLIDIEGPIAVMFISKSPTTINLLAAVLKNRLPGYICFEQDGASLASADSPLSWESLATIPEIGLYAGDLPVCIEYSDLVGLSLTVNDQRHINHDITRPFPLPANSVSSFQAEDVLEHIHYDQLLPVLNEIFRVLKPNGLFRLSLPDYGCDILQNRSIKDASGMIVFDPGGGGDRENPGHIWFPRIDTVRNLIEQSAFSKQGRIDCLHYYNMDDTFVAKSIDYSKGHVSRTPDFDARVTSPYRPMSMVIDLVKKAPQASESFLRNTLDVIEKTDSASRPTEMVTALSASSVEKSSIPATGIRSCIFLNSYYPAFLNDIYTKTPSLASKSHQAQKDALQNEFFGDSDFYSEGLKKAGWTAVDLIINCHPLQQAWAAENGFSGVGSQIAVEQIRLARPHVVYFQDLSIATKEFIEAIRPFTELIVGQIASPVPAEADLDGFDIVISSFPHFVERFRRMGITSYYQPLAFDPRVLEKFGGGEKTYPVTFVGGISAAHGKGLQFLEQIARLTEVDFWGYGSESLPQGSHIRERHHGEAWGGGMFSLLGQSRIAINRHIDVAENNANNMRIFESTGCGALLITDYKDNLGELFEIGKEIVAYRSPEECAALIDYYRAHPDEAEAIARAGQSRTLRDHTYQSRMRQTAEILGRHLRYRSEAETMAPPDMNRVSNDYVPISHNAVTDEMTTAWQNADIPAHQRSLVQTQLGEMFQGTAALPFQVLASLLKPVVNSGARILEIGCASGYYYEVLEYLLLARVDFTGVDYSQAMIAMANDYYPRARFEVADGAHLPFPDRSFPIVISGSILLHTPDYALHIQETARVAGKYIAAHRTPVCRTSPTSFFTKRAYDVETVELRFNEKEFIELFERQGFRPSEQFQYVEDMQHDQYEVSYLFTRVERCIVSNRESRARLDSNANTRQGEIWNT